VSAANKGAMAEFDLSQTDRLLTTTRAVRKRLDLERPVEPEVIQECIRIAIQAPTGGTPSSGAGWSSPTRGSEPGWRSSIVTRHGVFRGHMTHSGCPRPEDDPRAAQMARIVDSGVYLADRLQHVPLHVIPCVRRYMSDSGTFEVATMFGSILPARLELSARAACSRARHGAHHHASGAGTRGCRAARNSRQRHPGRADPGGLLHRSGFQASGTAPGRGDHLLEHLEDHRPNSLANGRSNSTSNMRVSRAHQAHIVRPSKSWHDLWGEALVRAPPRDRRRPTPRPVAEAASCGRPGRARRKQRQSRRPILPAPSASMRNGWTRQSHQSSCDRVCSPVQ
jgi:hypothetical protein